MRVVAFDPAERFGWADSLGPSGTWDLKVKRDESVGMRLIRLRGKLTELASVGVPIGFVAFEAARHAAPGMQGPLVRQAELQAIIKTFCLDADPQIEFKGYSPGEIKRHATGKGNANKEMMLAAARQKFGAVDDDNEADALWLLDLACKEAGVTYTKLKAV